MIVKEVRNLYQAEILQQIQDLPSRPNVVGFLATNNEPAHTYARFMRRAFERFDIPFRLRQLEADELPNAISIANHDRNVHGIFIFYPIFEDTRDSELRNNIAPEKDLEGLSRFWIDKLYVNDRFAVHGDQDKKAVLPCTSLAIVKVLEACFPTWGEKDIPLSGKVATVFNRSEVVGKPLAGMLSNDGAKVYSFDVHGPKLFQDGQMMDIDISRSEALSMSDIVVTGVPSEKFPLVTAEEIREEAVCVNFSEIENFTEAAREKSRIYIPRVGPVTVAMSIRNSLRLYENFHM
ncbi:MAG: bifunctional methylenetetrahydrofolate dehydrogenase/methenyltetrahydrofolate cyclohydrolase [Bacteroidota bacterium]